MMPIPLQARSRCREYPLHQGARRRIPLPPDGAGIRILHLRATFFSCATAIAMPRRMSTGSNPVTTIGTRYRSARGRYSSYPITVHTCPAARNAWTRFSAEERIASIAGGTSTWEHRIEKFSGSTARLPHGHRVGRRGPSRTQRQENNTPVRVLLRDLDSVQGGIDHPDRRPAGFQRQEIGEPEPASYRRRT